MFSNPEANAEFSRGALSEDAVLNPKIHRPRTEFRPGARILMNVIPMFLNVALPWVVFTLSFAACSFYLMYRYPAWVALALLAELFVCVALIRFAIGERKHDPNPTWYSYAAIALTVALFSGALLGRYNFEHFTSKYYQVKDLKVLGHLDPNHEQGRNVLDVGVAYFSGKTQVDGGRSWHFKHDTLYCVAPITSGEGTPDSGTYDFWAVGEDCCAEGSSDFRCGDWSDMAARGGIREMDEKTLPYFQLAVKQAESLFDVSASHPVFFHWSKDPVIEIDQWYRVGLHRFLYQISVFFIVALTAVLLVASQFSLLGRAKTPYTYGAKMAYDAVNYEAPGGPADSLHEYFGPRYGMGFTTVM